MPYFYYNRRSHRRRMLGSDYDDKVLAYDAIAYWPLDDPSDTVARCLVNPAQNGSYTGVTLDQIVTDASGVSFVCPLFDGALDYVNIHTAPLAAAFDGDEGTVIIWARVFDASVWMDGANRFTFRMVDTTDNNEYVQLQRTSTNSQLRWQYAAGGVIETASDATWTTTDWFMMAITWSASDDEVKSYRNDSLIDTDTVLGTWAGTVDLAIIGAQNTTPISPWHGWLAHCAVFGRALTQPEIADLAVV